MHYPPVKLFQCFPLPQVNPENVSYQTGELLIGVGGTVS